MEEKDDLYDLIRNKNSSTHIERFRCPSPKSLDNHKLEFILRQGKPILWIIGGPGVGKTTQADLLSQIINWNVIKINDFTANFETNCIMELKHRRKPLPNTMVIHMIKVCMVDVEENADGYIIDGFPTNREQSKLMEMQIGVPTAIIHLTFPFDGMLSREQTKFGNYVEVEDLRLYCIDNLTNLKPIISHYRDKVLTLYSDYPAAQLVAQIEEFIENRKH